MKTLSLLRHAKSSWDDPALEDRDRPLNDRGLRAAPVIGAWMAQQGLATQLVLSSPARRALDTATLVLPHLRPAPELRVIENIYMASPIELLAVLAQEGGEADHIMMVGHNPGMESLALLLARDGEDQLRQAMAQKFPTAALAVLRMERSDWQLGAEAESGSFDGGTLVSFTVPKELV